MKSSDWTGLRVPVLAHAFNLSRGVGVDVHLMAGSEKEALERLSRKLTHNQRFLAVSGGQYQVKLDREI